jgi:carboxylate-amine ligase
MAMLPFRPSEPPFTVGVELELQLIDAHTWNLATEAGDLLRRVKDTPHPGEIKPEITQSMIEISTAVHADHPALLAELAQLRDTLRRLAAKMNVRIAGGGTHPFQKWSERRIYPAERFEGLSEQYGYLAKLFTVFGQHIHVGCAGGDEAVYLTHALSRYVPHFIALAASSPFYQGVDTAFHSSRLSVVSAFPLSGVMPPVAAWEEFERYFDKMRRLGIVASMKDFYWDIRPKPELGTVEIRVCDTPLTVERAGHIACYAQVLAAWLLETRPLRADAALYTLYSYNRFQACRHGLQGVIIDPVTEQRRTIAADLLAHLPLLAPYAAARGAEPALAYLHTDAERLRNDAVWLKEVFAREGSLTDTVRRQCARWMGEEAAS